MDTPTKDTQPPADAPGESPTDCLCSYRMLRGREMRIVNPRCPKHGPSGSLADRAVVATLRK
jgi:hypothetical protein